MSVGLIKLSNSFRKPTYESVLLISGSSLFHSFIVYGKKRVLEDFCSTQCSKFGSSCTEFCKCNGERRILNLTLLKDSNGHCIRYTDTKVFSKPNFPAYEQNSRMYTGKYVSEKTRIFVYFTQCDVFHLLAQKRTHY